MSWCVYMHTNVQNGKRYIGITGQKPNKRWKNGLGYTGCPHFYSAIQKYGWDAFQHDILFDSLTKSEAEELEIELIKKYDTTNREKGYNAAYGGNSTSGYVIPEAGRRNISAAHVGNHHTEETKKKMSEHRKGVLNHFFGKHHSKTANRSNSISHGGHQVLCVETQSIYATLGEAERETGINRYQISGCCNEKPSCYTAGGYHWAFVPVDDSERLTERGG